MKAVAVQGVKLSASQDDMIVRAWLFGKQPKTVIAYQADARRFLAFVAKPLAAVTLPDLQAYAETLASVAHATRARRLAAVKSLLAFAQRLGAIPANPGAALRIEKAQATTAERVLSEQDVARLIGAETDPRRRAMLRLLYVCGLRAAEVCGLRWRDLSGNERKGGEGRVLGKGAKLRTVLIPADLWRELAALTPNARADAPVIPGRDGDTLSYAALDRAVKRACRRAGVNPDASAHWFRHSAATHALNNGAPVQVVQQRLGHASLTTTTRYLHVAADQGLAQYLKG